jgi:molecular chaperone DnaJ
MNPYDVLGIKKDASEKEIKKAYRDLCKENHPDKGGDAERFKEIGAAYEILSDSQKKQQYDMYGDVKGNQQGGSNFPGGFEDFINQMFNHDPFKRQKQRRGNDELTHIKLTLAEIMTGAKKNVTYSRNVKCDSCKGAGGENATKCGTCQGHGVVMTSYQTPIGMVQQQSKCPNCSDGYIIKNPCKKCSGSGVMRKTENITINIPAGVSSGHLPVEGAGNEVRNGITGNLMVRIEEIPEPNFVRDGNNLYTDMWISISEAVLGTQKVVKTPVTSFKFPIDAGSESGKIYNFNGRGIPNLAPDGRNYGNGNLYVKVNVTIPKNPTKEQKKIFEDLSKLEKNV